MRLTPLSAVGRRAAFLLILALLALAGSTPLLAQGGEADLRLPDLSQAVFLNGVSGPTLLMVGLGVAVLGLVFGMAMYTHLRKLPVHASMLEISELIYETCKTYLITQGKFLMILEIFIGVIIAFYFGVLQSMAGFKVVIILAFSLVGIAGSYGVAWFGIRVNTFANSRTAFASLRGKPFPCYAIPLQAGMSIGMMLISVELFIMLCILLFIPGDYAGPCFIGFAIGESLGAAVLRVAGGIFTKIADIGADLMKIVFKIKEDDARNPGVIADCTGDNAGDSVGPSADGFETYGVTGVALITFILLAVNNDITKVELLVWIFVMRVMMIIASALSYFINEAMAKARYQNCRQDELRSAADFAGVADFDHFDFRYLRDLVLDDSEPGQRPVDVVEAFDHHHLRNAGGRDYSGTGEGVYVGGIEPREGSGDVVARRRGVAEHSFGTGGGQLQRLLAGADHHGADGDCLRS